MNKKVFEGNRKCVMTGWKKVSYDDVTRIVLHTYISSYANKLIKEFSSNMGISETRFVELAITSATVGSKNWRMASVRFDLFRKEKAYLRLLRNRLVKRQIKDGKGIKPEDSELKALFERIVNEEICGRDLERLLRSNGLTFASKNVIHNEIDNEEKTKE